MSVSFEDLDVWKMACQLYVELYQLLKNCREYYLRDQIMRSALSIPSNIAEGSERGSIKEFRQFLNIAKGSAAELRTQVYILGKIGIIGEKKALDIAETLKRISRMMQALGDSLKKDRQSKFFREPTTDNR
jgi:four helix bundle protein